jgi:hypothetical protein
MRYLVAIYTNDNQVVDTAPLFVKAASTKQLEAECRTLTQDSERLRRFIDHLQEKLVDVKKLEQLIGELEERLVKTEERIGQINADLEQREDAEAVV